MGRPVNVLLLMLSLAIPAPAQQPTYPAPERLGTYQKVDPAGIDVQAAVKAAVEEQQKQSGQRVTLVSIVKAERRTIAPDNFRVCLFADRSGVTERAQVTVARDQKRKTWTTTIWSWGSCR
jgi:hypothetical protein